MKKLYDDAIDITPTTVKDKLPDSFNMDMIYDIASFAITARLFTDVQKIVIEHYNRRNIIRSAKALIPAAYNQEKDMHEVMKQA